jgi:WD40 repeat protein
LTSSGDRTLKVWRADDLEDDRVLQMPAAAPVTSLAWHPNDSRIAVGTKRGEALIFDSQTGKLTQKLDAGYQARLQSVAWSPDGRRLASGGWDEKVVVWDTETVEKVIEFNHDSEKPDDYIPNIVNSVSWNQDGTKIASSCYDSSIFVWNPENGDLIKRYAEDRGNIYSVDWNPVQPDLLAASTSIHGAWIWSLDQQQPKTIQTAGNQARCIRWNPDGTRFAVCRDDGLVTIHDTETLNLQVSLKNHLGQVFCVDWHPEGKRLATASEDGTVRIWDAVTGTQTISFDRLEGPVTSVGWSHDGQSLAAGGDRGIVQVFDATIGYRRAAGQSAP